MTTSLSSAEAIEWPEGKKAAAAFTFDVDAESPLLTANPWFGRRMGLMSHQSYGPLVGVPRILDLLKAAGVRSTFYVPGYTALRYSDQIKRIADGGHEIGHHGHLHEVLDGASPDDERRFLERGFEALRKAAGVEPSGYRAPMWEINWHTPEILGKAGFLYDSSLMDAEMPYELAYGSEGNSIVELPINWLLDDWNQYAFIPGFSGSGQMETPDKACELFQAEFNATRSIGGLFILTCHPFLSGRPGRAARLKSFIEYVASSEDVWLASMEEIAAYVREQRLTPRTIIEPDPSL